MAEAFNPQGRSKYLWVETIANPAAPTIAELSAGVDLTCSIMTDGVAGFTREPQYVDATPLCATAERTVNGLASTTNGMFTMLRADEPDDPGSDLLDALTDDVGTEGFVVFLPKGAIEAGALVDVFPSELSSVNAGPAQGGQAARYMVGFSHYGDFQINKTVAPNPS